MPKYITNLTYEFHKLYITLQAQATADRLVGYYFQCLYTMIYKAPTCTPDALS